jgi:hypothetical protein
MDEKLLEDAKAAVEYYPSIEAQEEEEQVSPSTFFNKGSVVVFPVSTQDEIKEAGSNVLGKPIELTFKQDVDPSDKWMRLGQNTILIIETDCTLLCVPHSYKTRSGWFTLDLSNADENTFPSKLDLSIEAGQSILMAHSIPWLLKEGRVKAYTITEPKKMASSAKLSTFSDCVVKHAELKDRIAKLDQRVWANGGKNSDTVNKYETTLNGMSDKKDIANYGKSLATLEKRIFDAENDTELPKVLALLEEIRTILDDPEKTRHIKGTSLKPARAKYEKFKSTEQNLIGEIKAIEKFLVHLQQLADNVASTTSTPKTNISSKPSAKKEAAVSEPPVESLVLDVPQIDVDTLTPHLIDHADGPDGYKAIIQMYQSDSTAISIMVQSLKNDQVTALYQKWSDERKRINVQVLEARRDPSLSVDVTLYVAYGKALKEIYSITKKHNHSTNSNTNTTQSIPPPPPQVKMIKCADCDKRARAFLESDLCKTCYTETTIEPILEKFDDRADYLARLAKREEEQDGPMNKLYEEYVDVHEELSRAFTSFKVPNSSAKAWEKLRDLMTKSDAMLPKTENDNDDEEEFNSKDGEGIVLHSDEEEDEEEEEEEEDEDEDDESSSSASRSKKRRKQSSSNEEADSLAHNTLLTLQRIPVLSIRESILDDYANERYILVREQLKRLDEVKEVYGFTVQSISKSAQGDEAPECEPEEWHTYYLKRNDAVHQANEISVPDKIKTKIEIKNVEKRSREKEEKKEEKKEKKHKKEEESE